MKTLLWIVTEKNDYSMFFPNEEAATQVYCTLSERVLSLKVEPVEVEGLTNKIVVYTNEIIGLELRDDQLHQRFHGDEEDDEDTHLKGRFDA